MASIVKGFEYDIFISYRQKDNKADRWVTEFVNALQRELDATFKEDISIYFDENPHDGLLETHSVNKSLEGKLKCLIFIPIISQTYCDPNSFAWQHELCAFNKMAKEDQVGRDIKLSNGNVSSRILPVKIHDLDAEDKTLLENELGGVLRAVEFIYKEAGVNRPLRSSEENPGKNQNQTNYRNQINKIANAIKELIVGVKNLDSNYKVTLSDGISDPKVKTQKPIQATNFFKKSSVYIFGGLVLAAALFLYFKFYRHPVTGVKSVAILPFVNMSNDPSQDFFSDGITDEILDALTHVKGLKVSSRTSSFYFKGKNPDLREVGKKLGVNTVLEGSIQKEGDQFRITVQLINVEDNFHIWSKKFDEKSGSLFAIEDKIANAVAEGLSLTLTGNEVDRKAPTENKEAYELYLKGRFFWNQRLPGALKKGIDFFGKAIELDPSYAKAYSGIADCYTALGWGSFVAPKESFPKAQEAALKALSLDSTLAEPHASLGYFKLYYDRDFETAEKEFKRAIALNPQYAIAYDWYGTYLTAMGRFEEARAAIKKAKDLDPLSSVFSSDMGFTLFYSGSYEQSIKELQSALEINPKYPIAHLWLSRAYQQKGLYPEAIAEYKKTLIVIPDWPVALVGIGNIYGIMGNKAEVNKMLDLLKALSQKTYVTPYGVALIYAGLGESDKAFQWLDKAYEERSNFLVWLKVDPRWTILHHDKRYAELVQRVGLPQ